VLVLALSEVATGLRIDNAWAMLGLLIAILAVSGWGLWAWLRQRRSAAKARSSMPLSCPQCQRGYPAGTVFCSLDGERLVGAAPSPAVPSARGGRCPRCQRIFPSGMRYCPVDAEELQGLADWRGDLEHAAPEADHDHLVGGEGKICPVCASRYALEAQVCGRDGSDLVTIN
jgi:RNA polymerase subunit RPABC4/transcription elongation factor Spt4